MELALLIAIFIGSTNAACPSNFVASTTIPGKCYHVTNSTYNFFDSVKYCRNLIQGADILSIANGFENSEVANLVNASGLPRQRLKSRFSPCIEESGAWIGNVFYDNKSHWIATAASSSNYSNWGSGIYNGEAALICSSGSWGYTYASSNYGICQLYPDDPTTFPPPQITCPAGWRPSISVRGKCYKLITFTDFFSATRWCLTTRIGGSHAELVTLTSQLEMMELYATAEYYTPWASLTSWKAGGDWHWVETLHPTDYFGPDGHPSDAGGTCVNSDRDNLYAAPCWTTQAAICQYFPGEPPAPTLPGLICPYKGIASLTKPGTCYYVLSQSRTFQSARNACRTLNTGFNYDLFVPRTAAEYEEFKVIVLNQGPYLPVWLGLASSNGNWGWISGRSSNITKMWCKGQPDTSQNPNHQCAFVNSQNIYNNPICWRAGDCTDSYAAVCQSTNTF